jgi:hypothetical protein
MPEENGREIHFHFHFHYFSLLHQFKFSKTMQLKSAVKMLA